MRPYSSLISCLTEGLCKIHVHRYSISKLPTQQQKLKCSFYSNKDVMKLCLMVCRLHFYKHLQCSHSLQLLLSRYFSSTELRIITLCYYNTLN